MNKFLVLTISLLVSAAFLLGSSWGSSHGEAPREVNSPTTDAADLYVFNSYEVGRKYYVTFLANFAGRQRGTDGPNFHPLDDKFFYDINVDTTGDGRAEIVYQFSPKNEFASPPDGIQLNIGGRLQSVALKTVAPLSPGNEGGLNTLEYYGLNVISNGITQAVTQAGSGSAVFRKPFDYAGHKTFADYNAYANSFIYDIDIPGCAKTGRVFVGQRAEPFSINIGPIFDLVNFIPIDPSEFPGGIDQSPANNQVGSGNVASLALEVPRRCLGLTQTETTIGVWITARAKRTSSRQRSRLGNPLVNELLIGLPVKDKWTRRSPSTDGRLNNFIAYPTFPEILSILFLSAVNAQLGTSYATLAPTNFPRQDLVAILLTGIPGVNLLAQGNTLAEMLRLNTAIPAKRAADQNQYGVFEGDLAGYPNGRRPGDDIVDIVLRAVMGKTCYLGLGVCSPSDAVVGNLTFTDGAPIRAGYFQTSFPYFNIPNTAS